MDRAVSISIAAFLVSTCNKIEGKAHDGRYECDTVLKMWGLQLSECMNQIFSKRCLIKNITSTG